MGYGMRKFPRFEDAVTFDDAERDYRGFPNMTIEYELTDAERTEIEAATERLRRAGSALGTFVAEPRLMPNGSSLHYQGTMRMGDADDGTRSPTLVARMGLREPGRGRQRPHPDPDGDEPDAHERRDRGPRGAEGRRAAAARTAASVAG